MSREYGSCICKPVSFYDGDTFRADIPGFPSIVGQRMGIRVNGIDTPERRDKRPQVRMLAQRAKELTVKLVRSASLVELRSMKRGKYFRIVADVYLDGESLAEKLLQSGLAQRYDGKRKPKW